LQGLCLHCGHNDHDLHECEDLPEDLQHDLCREERHRIAGTLSTLYTSSTTTSSPPLTDVYTQEMLDTIEYEKEHDQDGETTERTYDDTRTRCVPNRALFFTHIQELFLTEFINIDHLSHFGYSFVNAPMYNYGVFNYAATRQRIIDHMRHIELNVRPGITDITSAYNLLALREADSVFILHDSAESDVHEFSDTHSDSGSESSDSSQSTEDNDSDSTDGDHLEGSLLSRTPAQIASIERATAHWQAIRLHQTENHQFHAHLLAIFRNATNTTNPVTVEGVQDSDDEEDVQDSDSDTSRSQSYLSDDDFSSTIPALVDESESDSESDTESEGVIADESNNYSDTDEDDDPICLSFAAHFAAMDDTESDDDEDPRAYERHTTPVPTTPQQPLDSTLFAYDSQGHCSETEFTMFSANEYAQHCQAEESDEPQYGSKIIPLDESFCSPECCEQQTYCIRCLTLPVHERIPPDEWNDQDQSTQRSDPALSSQTFSLPRSAEGEDDASMQEDIFDSSPAFAVQLHHATGHNSPDSNFSHPCQDTIDFLTDLYHSPTYGHTADTLMGPEWDLSDSPFEPSSTEDSSTGLHSSDEHHCPRRMDTSGSDDDLCFRSYMANSRSDDEEDDNIHDRDTPIRPSTPPPPDPDLSIYSENSDE
ncbi:hypothetical protein B484DRAFT_439024, partial [Ochromonadaceae sp. CCMP2298]